jgi:hypothetical protein
VDVRTDIAVPVRFGKENHVFHLFCHPSPMRTKKNEFRHQTKKKAINRELQNPTWLTIYYTQYIIIPLVYWSLGHF